MLTMLDLSIANLITLALVVYLGYQLLIRTKSIRSQSVPSHDYFRQQSVPVNDIESERKLKYYDGDGLLVYLHEDAKTLLDSLKRAARICADRPEGFGTIDLSTKQIIWTTYAKALERAKHFGDGLVKLGQRKASIVGIYSDNRLEYFVAEYGCYWHSIIIAPIYSTLGPNIATFIANQGQVEVIVCDTLESVQSILSQAANYTHLKYIVAMDNIPVSYKHKASNFKLTVLSVDEVEELGRKNVVENRMEPKPSDVALICYTSGTTGDPKGVILTHVNIVAAVSGLVYQMFDHKLNMDDYYFSYLPLGHVMERTAEVAMMVSGTRIIFNVGGIANLLSNIQIAKPTVFLTVPRLVNRIYDKIHANLRGNILKQFLFNQALASKRKAYREGNLSSNSFWDLIVFNKIRAVLGGRVRVFSTGSASLDPHVADVLRSIFNCVFLNGYGQTECASCSLSLPFDDNLDHVGPPLASAMIKLGDIPEMDYYVADGKGEVLVKGPMITQGYYKNDAETKQLFDEDGWLKTGDVGCWTPKGTLQIIDRKKNIFKLSQGEYIAAEKLTHAYTKSLFVAQIYVYGDSKRSFLVAIMVPDKEYLEEWCTLNHTTLNIAELCNSKLVKTAILDDLNRIAQEEKFNKLEYIKNVFIHPELFTVENNLLTPTMKLKRHEVQKKFLKEIEALYLEHSICV